MSLADLSPTIEDHPLRHTPSALLLQGADQEVVGEDILMSTQSTNCITFLQNHFTEYDLGDIVYHYCRQNTDVRALLLFNLSDSFVPQIIDYCARQEQFVTVFARQYSFTSTGAENVTSLCYGHNGWFNNSLKRRMTRERFSITPQATLIVFKSSTSPVEIKENLRNFLPGRTFSRKIHGTDTHDETMVLVEALVSPNCRDLLNQVGLSRNDRLFQRIPEHVRNETAICVDGSAVLELYGLRDARDIDLLVWDSTSKNLSLSGFDIRNDRYGLSPLSPQLVIRDPRFHLIIYGVKFTTLLCRFVTLALEPKGGLHPKLANKAMGDFQTIALHFSQTRKLTLSFRVFIGTFLTRIRQLYEFLLNRIVPRLPLGLNELLPAIRKRLHQHEL